MSTPSRMFGILGGSGGGSSGLDTLITKTLDDNDTTLLESFSISTYDSVWIFYTIKRAGGIRSGTLILASDGTDSSLAEYHTGDIGDVGALFTSSVSGVDMQISVTLASQGADAEINYRVLRNNA